MPPDQAAYLLLHISDLSSKQFSRTSFRTFKEKSPSETMEALNPCIPRGPRLAMAHKIPAIHKLTKAQLDCRTLAPR